MGGSHKIRTKFRVGNPPANASQWECSPVRLTTRARESGPRRPSPRVGGPHQVLWQANPGTRPDHPPRTRDASPRASETCLAGEPTCDPASPARAKFGLPRAALLGIGLVILTTCSIVVPSLPDHLAIGVNGQPYSQVTRCTELTGVRKVRAVHGSLSQRPPL